jgi:hypothetical protein
VMFPRERILSWRAMPRCAAPPTDALDLRLGARGGSTTMTADRPTEMLQTRRGLGSVATAHPSGLCFATVYRTELLAAAAARRIRVDV